MGVASIDISYECIIRRGNDLPKTVKHGIVGVIDCQGTRIRGYAGAKKRRGHTVQIAVPFKLDYYDTRAACHAYSREGDAEASGAVPECPGP